MSRFCCWASRTEKLQNKNKKTCVEIKKYVRENVDFVYQSNLVKIPENVGKNQLRKHQIFIKTKTTAAVLPHANLHHHSTKLILDVHQNEFNGILDRTFAINVKNLFQVQIIFRETTKSRRKAISHDRKQYATLQKDEIYTPKWNQRDSSSTVSDAVQARVNLKVRDQNRWTQA